jgi:hypothetical protein
MMAKLESLWINHRTLTIIIGLVLLPITLAIVGMKIYMLLNVKGAAKSLENAQKKDDVLSAEQEALVAAANEAIRDADEAAKRISNRAKEETVDLDWHTKRKD